MRWLQRSEQDRLYVHLPHDLMRRVKGIAEMRRQAEIEAHKKREVEQYDD
jgi:hypothetical protein